MGKLGGHLVVFSLPYPISAAPAGVALPPGAAGRTLHEEHEALRLLAPVVRRSCWTPISMLTRCERCKQKGQMSAPNNSNNYILRIGYPLRSPIRSRSVLKTHKKTPMYGLISTHSYRIGNKGKFHNHESEVDTQFLRYHFDPSPIALSLFFHDLLASYAMHHAPSPPRNHQPSGRLGSSRWQSLSS